MAMKYYQFVCFQKYEFNTTNSYVTNQKKLAIKKHMNSYETAFAYRERKKLEKNRGSPLSPGMRESVNLLPKYFVHQPKKGDGTSLVCLLGPT
jgi:hypothetical protein